MEQNTEPDAPADNIVQFNDVWHRRRSFAKSTERVPQPAGAPEEDDDPPPDAA